ncbi:sulfatase [Aureococcus anophagefferens]|nr:sulfatase [Aureococcus anophagefferens]
MFRALWLLGALEAARASETASETCSVEHWMSTFEAGGTLPLHCCGAEIGPFGQDQWLREAIFGGRRDGVFVELGGYDAVVASNTWFYERCRGWTGVVIEPQAPRHAGFLRLRPNASLAPHCVSDVPGEQVTFVSLPGGTGLAGVESASLEDAIDRLDKRGRAAIVKDTKTCHRVASILARRRVTHVDFFSLDCEGCELKAVRSIDFDAVTVDVFTIEQSAAGVAAAKFLVDERNYVNVGRLSADVVLVRGDLRMPCAARAPLPSRFAKLPAFPDAQKLAAAAAAEGSGHSRDAVERAREIAGPLDRPVAYDAVDRPNLVLVVLDDASPDMFPDAYPEYASEAWQSARYGSPKTPSIAALAREGAAFRAAYAPALCGPSRASLLTGRYPSETGYLHNQLRMASPAAAAAHALLPALLKGAGYATAMAGKWGVGPSKQGIPGDLAAARFDTYLMHDAGLSEHNAKDCGGDAHATRVANPPRRRRTSAATGRRATGASRRTRRRTRPGLRADDARGLWAGFGGTIRRDLPRKQTPAPFFLYYPTVLVHETENRTLPRADAPGDNGLKPTTDRLRPGGYWLARMKRLRPSTIVWVVSDNAAAYRGKGRGVERGASVVSVVAAPARGAVDGLMDSTCLFPTLLDFASVTHDRPRSLAAYLRGARNDVGFRFVAAEIGGSRVIRANGTLLEASNGLLGVAPGRLYATTGFSPADGFLAFHEFEAMEHLSSPPWYKRKDERSDPACPSPLGFCPRNNSAGRAVDFMNTYGLPVLRPEADADRALLFGACGPNGKYSHFSPKLRGACPPAAAFAARHETPAPLSRGPRPRPHAAAASSSCRATSAGVNNAGAAPGALVDAVRAGPVRRGRLRHVAAPVRGGPVPVAAAGHEDGRLGPVDGAVAGGRPTWQR